MLKKLIFISAAFTSLSATLIGVHSFIDTEASLLWMICKIAGSIAVVGVGILTWQNWRKHEAGHFATELWLLGAMGLLVLAGASVAWTIHLAQVTGDFEAWVVMINLVMVGQGALTIWHLWRKNAKSDLRMESFSN